jgi:homoserine O-acetyltransferase
MDSHHVGRGRGGLAEGLSRVQAKTLVIGIESDLLFPLAEQEFLAKQIAGARLEVLDSPYGHDAFLMETKAITPFLEKLLHAKSTLLSA